MNACLRFLTIAVLVGSSAGFAIGYHGPWPALPGKKVESVEVQSRKIFSATKPVEVSMFIGLPGGCYRAEVRVEHHDDYTHILKPEVRNGDYPCLQISRFDFQKVNLGTLPAGEHVIYVENVARPSSPVSITVIDDELSLAE